MSDAPKHRHERSSWIICGGHAEWCYACGAWRQLRRVSVNAVEPAGKWHKPSGNPKENPAAREYA